MTHAPTKQAAAHHYDVVVLGAGSGNEVIDDGFASMRVAIVEPGPLGGTCLNRGCIPSKMFIHAADVVREAERGPELDVRTGAQGADWSALRSRVLGRVGAVEREGREGREGEANIDLLVGTARFLGRRHLEVTTADGTRELTADHVVIATGSRPALPDIPGLDTSPHHTSDTVMHLDGLPETLVVLGGGYVGCEFAHLFASLGVAVTQVESDDVLLSEQDRDVAERFTRAARRSWTVLTGVEASRVSSDDDAGHAVITLSDGSEIETDLILVATGRRPNSDVLDLDVAGVDVDDDGLIVVDPFQQTTADGVWALGDVCQGAPLKHVANHEARVVKHNLLHSDDLESSDHRFIPSAVFTHPAVAAVGQTEEEAAESGIDLAIGTAEYGDTAFGWALQSGPDDPSPDAAGFAKVLVDRQTRRLVGAHILGPHAAMLIQPLIQAMSFDQDATALARGQYWIHPALTEVVEAALLDVVEELRPT